MSRTRRLVLVSALVLAAAVGWLVLQTAAFHFLPPAVTGEAERLAAVLGVSTGHSVAEIGAGAGALTVEMARVVGAGGTVYSTELDAGRRAEIQSRVRREGLEHVVVVEGLAADANLPDACCDAVFMRNVYHHLGDVKAFNASLRRAIRPGGRLAVIDFPPATFLHLPGRPDGASTERSGHGVAPRAVVAEMTAAGFEVQRELPDWGGRLFLVLFRAPDRDPS